MSCRITGGNKIRSDCAAGCSFFDYPLQPKKVQPAVYMLSSNRNNFQSKIEKNAEL